MRRCAIITQLSLFPREAAVLTQGEPPSFYRETKLHATYVGCQQLQICRASNLVFCASWLDCLAAHQNDRTAAPSEESITSPNAFHASRRRQSEVAEVRLWIGNVTSLQYLCFSRSSGITPLPSVAVSRDRTACNYNIATTLYQVQLYAMVIIVTSAPSQVYPVTSGFFGRD